VEESHACHNLFRLDSDSKVLSETSRFFSVLESYNTRTLLLMVECDERAPLANGHL
jgi:hypothetical protein